MAESAHAANQRLARTINLGLAFDQAREGMWGVALEARHFDLCACWTGSSG
jgi:hypothetical protein